MSQSLDLNSPLFRGSHIDSPIILVDTAGMGEAEFSSPGLPMHVVLPVDHYYNMHLATLLYQSST